MPLPRRKKKGTKGDKGDKGKKGKNKKNTSNKKDQKRDETWKQVPPKENKKKEKQVGKYTYNWCEHHMACVEKRRFSLAALPISLYRDIPKPNVDLHGRVDTAGPPRSD